MVKIRMNQNGGSVQISRKRLFLVLSVVALALSLGLSYYPGSNVNSRVGMVFQAVEAGTIELGPWAGKTNDASVVGDKAFNGKAPGSAYLAIPFYFVIHLLIPSLSHDTARYLLRLLTLLPLCLVAAWLGAAMLDRTFKSASSYPAAHLAFAPAWLLGTVAFPFSVVLFGHQYAAALLLIAFYCLFRMREDHAWKWPVLAGLSCGWAILTEYPAALICLFLGIYLLIFCRSIGRIAVFGLIGIALPAAGIGIYNNACFGSPFTFGYQSLAFSGYSTGMSEGLLGVSWPKLSSLWEVTFSSEGGLFFNAPWLLAFPAGLYAWIRNRERRPEGIALLAIIVSYLAFNAGYWEPGGAMSFGPRHLVPAVGFFALTAFVGGLSFGPIVRGIFFGAVAVSVLVTAFGTFADPLMPDRLINPLYEFALPLMLSGQGLGSIIGLKGAALFWIFCGLMIVLLGGIWRLRNVETAPNKPMRIAAIASIGLLALVYGIVFPGLPGTDTGMLNQVLGNYYFEREDFMHAQAAYKLAGEHRVDPYIHYYRGRALLRLGMLMETKEAFETVLAIDPNFPQRNGLIKILEQIDAAIAKP